ncbi:RTA1-domain-containing protein [Clavulina sp. PMI_390]|nr:RTA1-domain-containing protein [Clavulina sp. PMI_390]
MTYNFTYTFPNGTRVFPNGTLFDPGHYKYHTADGLDNGGPTGWISILFLVLFSISTIIHLGQTFYFRRWFLLPSIVLGGLGEVIGWAGRYWSSRNPILKKPFLVQITTTVISPTFLTAANFIVFGHVILLARAERFSRLTPKLYSILFVSIDFIALVVQAFGGAKASGSDPVSGGHIMLAGIIIGLVSIVVYVAVAGEVVYRIYKNQPYHRNVPDTAEGYNGKHGLEPHHALMIRALAFSSFVLFIRAIYRTAELSGGYQGHIIETQVYFNVFDAAMVVLSMYSINVFHPGWLLQYRDQDLWARLTGFAAVPETKESSNSSLVGSA